MDIVMAHIQQETANGAQPQAPINGFQGAANPPPAAAAPQALTYLQKNKAFVDTVKQTITEMHISTNNSTLFSGHFKNWNKKSGLNQKVKKIMESYYKKAYLHPKRHHKTAAENIIKFCKKNPTPEALFLHLMQEKKALESMKYERDGSFHRRLMFCIDRVQKEGHQAWAVAESHKYLGQEG